MQPRDGRNWLQEKEFGRNGPERFLPAGANKCNIAIGAKSFEENSLRGFDLPYFAKWVQNGAHQFVSR